MVVLRHSSAVTAGCARLGRAVSRHTAAGWRGSPAGAGPRAGTRTGRPSAVAASRGRRPLPSSLGCVRHPGLKVSIPAHTKHPGWCVDLRCPGCVWVWCGCVCVEGDLGVHSTPPSQRSIARCTVSVRSCMSRSSCTIIPLLAPAPTGRPREAGGGPPATTGIADGGGTGGHSGAMHSVTIDAVDSKCSHVRSSGL